MSSTETVLAPACNGSATDLAHAFFDEVIAPAAADGRARSVSLASEPERSTYFVEPIAPKVRPSDFDFPGGGDPDTLVEALVEHWAKQGEDRLATSGQRLKQIIAALRLESVESNGDVDPYCYTMF